MNTDYKKRWNIQLNIQMQCGDYLVFETKLYDYFSDASNIVIHVCNFIFYIIKGNNKDVMEYVWPLGIRQMWNSYADMFLIL